VRYGGKGKSEDREHRIADDVHPISKIRDTQSQCAHKSPNKIRKKYYQGAALER